MTTKCKNIYYIFREKNGRSFNVRRIRTDLPASVGQRTQCPESPQLPEQAPGDAGTKQTQPGAHHHGNIHIRHEGNSSLRASVLFALVLLGVLMSHFLN